MGVPYTWAKLRVTRSGDRITYAGTRRWPERGLRTLAEVTIGEPVDPASVAPLFPPGIAPDVFADGLTYVGLVPFVMHRSAVAGRVPLPYFGAFAETNVRLYSVDAHGRRGVVFRSLEASRLAPVLVARWAFRLPYMWAKMSINRDGDVIRYRARRRWPLHDGRPTSDLAVRVGGPVAAGPFEDFLTARWGLHNDWFGHTRYLPNIHPAWPLYDAELLDLDDELIVAAGLPAPVDPPASVLYSPGVPVKFGRPV